MDTGSLNKLSYDEIAGLGQLQTLGSAILSLALSVHMLIELYKYLHHGKADFISPIIKIGLAILVINALVPIGSFLSSAVDQTSQSLLKEDVQKLAGDAWAPASDSKEKTWTRALRKSVCLTKMICYHHSDAHLPGWKGG